MSGEKQVKVLVVEDANVVRMLLVHLLNSDPQIKVIGTAKNGREALEFLARHTPDVVLMDIEMPEMDGFETTRRIMESRPVPIVICSASGDPAETATTFRLMEAGALAFVEKPVGKEHADFEAMAAHLLQTVKLMSEVKVVRRWRRHVQPAGTPGSSPPPAWAPHRAAAKIDVIGIGASTGGPPVLQTILSALPKDFPVPLLVVQHIAPGFLPALADWLNQSTGLTVHIAAYGMEALPGHVYLAPDDYHLGVRAGGGHLVLNKEPPDGTLRPSVAHLFRSLASAYGQRAVGVLLTGMGRDGASELRQMKDRGAITIAQDKESSIIHGMPGAAIELDAATHVLPADRIAPALAVLVNQQPFTEGRTS